MFLKVVSDNVISDTLKTALTNDAILFGTLRTHAQLFEANSLLLNSDGKIKSLTQLEHELDKLNITYNNNYIEAERQFAISSSISADRWSKISDRYNLQYRTANDSKVRDEHRVLHSIVLPVEDEFWKQYYPPNGWRCRCIAVQVRKGKYPESNSENAIKAGENATTQIGKNGKNTLEIFRFNPGVSLKLMPPEHPYNKVTGADKIKLNLEDVFKKRRALKKEEIKQWIQKNIPTDGKIINLDNFSTGKIHLRRKDVRSISDHFTDLSLKELSKDIFEIIKKAQLYNTSEVDPNSHNYIKKIERGVEGYNYYKLVHKNLNLRLNIEVIKGKEYVYSINIIIK